MKINKRYFNQIKVDCNKGTIEKKSMNIDKFIGEIKWYLELPLELQCYVPRVFEYSLDRNDAFIKMEYYGYPCLSSIYLNESCKADFWNDILDSIFFVINDMKKYKKIDDGNTSTEMYCTKTINRLEEIRKNPEFRNYFNEKIIINSKEYEPLNYYIEKIKKINIPLDSLSIIHGDFCLSNILYDLKNRIIKLIDPRGKFGKYTIYGDLRYDLAKLSHSFNGNYELIINDLFTIKTYKNKIFFNLFDSEYKKKVRKMFNSKLKKEYQKEINTINLIEALLFLSMIPLHKDFVDRQKVMFAIGIEKIARCLN